MIDYNANLKISDFILEIVAMCRNPVDCKISEAKYIESMKPPLNRKHELSYW